MRLINRRGLRIKLVVPILLITVPAITAVVLSLGSLGASLLREAAERELAATAQSAAGSVQHWIQSTTIALQSVAVDPDVISMNARRQQPVISRMKKVYERLTLVQTIGTDGRIVAVSDGAKAVDCYDPAWIQMCLAGLPVPPAGLKSPATGKTILALSVPIRNADGKIVGVATAVSDLATLAAQIELPNSPETNTILLDEKGRALVDPALHGGDPLPDLSGQLPVRQLLHGHDGAMAFVDSDGRGWLVHSVRLPNGWAVLSEQDEQQVMVRGAQIMGTAYWLAGAALFLVAILPWIVATRLIAPIRELTDAAGELAAGKWDRRVPETREDELGLLAKAFNRMVVQLERGYRHIEEEVGLRTGQLRRSNDELKSAKATAEQANRAKDQFLANMSHEIRTPMTAILGFADIVLEPDQTVSDRHDSLQAIRRNARHLSELINDVLDISKIEAGQMTLEKIPCDLPQLIAQTAALVRPRVTDKGLEFRLVCDGPVPRQITTDPLRLRQILVNLIGNAQKFTEKGGIELRVYCQMPAKTGASCMVQFSVTDTGIGMSPPQMDRLFRPFTQADASTTRRFGGTGLGLSISKSLAKLLGGDIVARSQPGAGTTFTVTIDGGSVEGVEMLSALSESQLLGPAPSEAVAPTISIRGRILLVEDGPDNQRLISLHLRRAGADVAVAENGRIAVDRIETETFDLVLMDMQMPEMDGYAATAELRKRGCKLPIIALTAHALAEDRDRCLRAGCDEYLTKPIDRSKLLGTIRSFLPELSPEDQAAQAAAERPTAFHDSPQDTPVSPVPGALVTSTLAHDPDLKDLLDQFIANLPGKLTRLTDLLARNDLEELRRLVHQLKGAGGGYGFPQITEKAAAIEAQIRASAPAEILIASVGDLADLIGRIEGYPKPSGESFEKPKPSAQN